jgi:hypothetical protein
MSTLPDSVTSCRSRTMYEMKGPNPMGGTRKYDNHPTGLQIRQMPRAPLILHCNFTTEACFFFWQFDAFTCCIFATNIQCHSTPSPNQTVWKGYRFATSIQSTTSLPSITTLEALQTCHRYTVPLHSVWKAQQVMLLNC